MRTPEEIKKGLECCSSFDSDMCLQCPYDDGHIACCLDKNQDALAYIQQLEARLAQAEHEKDAAVRDLDDDGDCYYCKNRDLAAQCDFGSCCDCGNEECPCFRCDRIKNNFEWRGVCPENTKEDTKE